MTTMAERRRRPTRIGGPVDELAARRALDGMVAVELRMIAAAIDQAGSAVVTTAGGAEGSTIANALAGYGMQLRELARALDTQPAPDREE